MLVLAREVGESIVIGGDSIKGGGVTVTVVGVERGRAELSIDAHQDISIYREELLDPRRIK